jgi:serine phosphatase RsbU (regulator of sigma subunit)
VRDASFEKYIELKQISYKPNDMLILYTDGIIEAKNKSGEEFGYERLCSTIEVNAGRSPKEIKKVLIDRLTDFAESKELDDDYTLLIIRFL